MHELIYDSKVIHADETPVKVMRIDNAKIKNGKKTYMWVYRNRSLKGTHPIVLYDWQDSRRSDHPREFLKTFSGTVVTDGYQVYHKLEKEREDLKVAGCWIHARRPFADFIKSVGLTAAKGSIAQEAYDMITEMLRMGCKERTFKNKLSYPHRCGKRIFDNSHIISAGNGIYIRFRS